MPFILCLFFDSEGICPSRISTLSPAYFFNSSSLTSILPIDRLLALIVLMIFISRFSFDFESRFPSDIRTFLVWYGSNSSSLASSPSIDRLLDVFIQVHVFGSRFSF
jgi:hypothetical protein